MENPALICNREDDCAILFARAPVPGRVKTRFLPHLTPVQSSELHLACVKDALAMLATTLPNAAQWLFWSEQTEINLPLPGGFRTAIQVGVNLGERMANAFQRAFSSGARNVVLFGSDSPTLPPDLAAQAFAALDHSDLVLGPTEDGGYYLIGSRRFDPQIFSGVGWSTPRAFEQTLANARRLNFSVSLLDRWYDLDEWKDIERLLTLRCQGETQPENIEKFLKQLELQQNV